MSLIEVLKSMRPKQWLKNIFIFAPIIFSQNIFYLPLLLKTTIAFITFCILSGSMYILNDLKDLEEDKLHPIKLKRPIASGELKKLPAILFFVILCSLSFVLAITLNIYFFIIAIIYFFLQISYSFWLKHFLILDVFVIAAGFLIRVVAGGLAIEVSISTWILICTILLALFLAMGKRRHELVLLGKDASTHRTVLAQYSPYLLDQMIGIVAASTLIS